MMVNVAKKENIIEKPWGRENILASMEDVTLKYIIINPGEALSWQVHKNKNETMMLVSGQAYLEIVQFGSNESPYHKKITMHKGYTYNVTPGTMHRLVSISLDVETIIAEVSKGNDSDIIRLFDRYNRVG